MISGPGPSKNPDTSKMDVAQAYNKIYDLALLKSRTFTDMALVLILVELTQLNRRTTNE